MKDAKLRQSQVITTYGPGALIDLPDGSAIMAGLDAWPRTADLERIFEARLTGKLRFLTGDREPQLYAPPGNVAFPPRSNFKAKAYEFPDWFLVQDEHGEEDKPLSRRLVHRTSLDHRGRFDGKRVVATRFVRACASGHVSDLNWREFVHRGHSECKRQLWLDERGTTGDLGDLVVRCECKARREMSDAGQSGVLGTCTGDRPWLATDSRQPCSLPARLLIRTATNAYFPQVMSVLSLPESKDPLASFLANHWDDFSFVEEAAELGVFRKKYALSVELIQHSDDEVLQAIAKRKAGDSPKVSVKRAEIEAIRQSPAGYGDDIPIDHDFHCRRLPEEVWRNSALLEPIEAVYQLHRLREVIALIGFTRLEPIVAGIDGDFDPDVSRAPLALDTRWFPAIENRGEGLFVLFRRESIEAWSQREAVRERVKHLEDGYLRWKEKRQKAPDFPGAAYVMLHTFSHLLINTISLSCGYPSTSLRERIYVDIENGAYGVLLMTASADADGTLGGLVAQGRHLGAHVHRALQSAALCSTDPICGTHVPSTSREGRWLHGASCHGCTFIAETSCEMRNDYLDRALVSWVIGCQDASIFARVD